MQFFYYICRNCVNTNFDSLGLIGGVSQTHTLLFETLTDINQTIDAQIQYSFVSDFLNCGALIYFSNTNSEQVEYILDHVQFNNNEYIGAGTGQERLITVRE